MNRENKDEPPRSQPGESSGCTGAGEDVASLCALKRTLITPREEKVLASIRENREKAAILKARIGQLEEQGPEREEYLALARKELEELRRRRAEFEEERIAAAGERMRLLGHE